MDPKEPTPTRRKTKFIPGPPPNRKLRLPATQTEQLEDTGEFQAEFRHLSGSLTRREPKVERKQIVQVAFGPGDRSTTPLRTYGSKSSGSASKDLTAKEDQSDTCMIYSIEDNTNASAWKNRKEYKEPWDYHTYYPITLPLRKPYSGDPEILDQEEFGEAAASMEYDEKAVNSAAELGLLEKSEEERLLFFQLPLTLPTVKQTVSRKGKEKVGSTSTVSGDSTKVFSLEELPQGHIGKMLAYKSGAIKLKLGETLFDVSPGTNTSFAQNVLVMNPKEKHCGGLGELGKKAILTPDLGSIELYK